MKRITFFILLIATTASAQLTAPAPRLVRDSVFVFSRTEVVTTVNKIRKLQAKCSAADSLLSLYRWQIADYSHLITDKNEMLKLATDQIALKEINEDHYKKIIADLEPSWLDRNKWLLFVTGLICGISTLFIAKL